MLRRRFSIASLSLLLILMTGLGGCDPLLGSFNVPSQVWSGQVFEVVVGASTTGSPGVVGAILQLPLGFGVEGAVGVGSGASTVVVPGGGQGPPPSLIAVEPGHFVTGFSGSYVLGLFPQQFAALKVYVRAPAAAGAFTLKVVLTGDSGTQPPGTTSFATITAPPYAQPITVVGSPVSALYAAPVPLPANGPVWNRGIALGDVDGDGLDDVAVCTSPAASSPSVAMYVLRNRSAGPWLPAALPPNPVAINRVAFGDFDGDGQLDIVDGSGRILYGDGGITWRPGPVLPLHPEWAGVAVGDVDGDGRDDVAFSALTTDAVQVFHSEANRTFTEWSNGLPNATNGPAGADRLAIADISGDGHPDLVASGGIGLRVWTGDGQGNWQAASTGLPAAQAFGIGDFDGDGRRDLALSPSSALVVYTFGMGTWQQLPMTVSSGINAPGNALAVLDCDRDGWPDVVLASAGRPQLFRNVGGQSFAIPIPLAAMLPPGGVSDLAAGDVDGDTWPDFVAAIGGEPPIVWHNTGSGLSRFGSACGAQGLPTPDAVGIGQPLLGNASFAVGLQGASPSAPGMIWIGLSNRYAFGAPILPYDLAAHGAPGCSVFASSEALFLVIADAQGRASVPLPIPNNATLRRTTVFAQTAASATGANPLGWLFANGLAIKVP